jgi:enolase
MLGISIAFAKALAADKKVPLWKILKSEFFAKGKESTPLIFSNLVNGGLHAKNDLSFQEYMVVVKKSGSYEKTIGDLIHFYRTLGEKLTEDYKISSLPIGDEGGYALNFKNNLEPLVILQDLIEKNNLGGKFSIAIDAAASDFRKDGLYMVDGNPLSTIQLAALYRDYLEKIPRIISIEDPFHESDYDGFRAFRKLAPKTVTVGDDITVTSRERILQCADDGLITGVIIKPNQIGTVSETCAAISAAQEKGVKVITSHRSGETEDAFIIHFAKACGAWGIKIGAPAKERLIKYNEIIRIFDL